jgi:hypothetical protein
MRFDFSHPRALLHCRLVCGHVRLSVRVAWPGARLPHQQERSPIPKRACRATVYRLPCNGLAWLRDLSGKTELPARLRRTLAVAETD